MKKVYNKLVRDNIIDIITADNKTCSFGVLNDNEYLDALKKARRRISRIQ